MKDMTIALAGNPNSGKTTTFNMLTGSRQHVGNYPGVTVTKKEGFVRDGDRQVRIVDLPGTYSLTAYTAEELAARDFLLDERPDAVLDVIDAGALERSLYLTVQFLEMGVPVVLALNMMDEVRKRNMTIDTEKLSKLLQMPVVETVAKQGQGVKEGVKAAIKHAAEHRDSWKPLEISYSQDIDETLDRMVERIEEEQFLTDRYPARWLALKYLEEDEQIRVLGRQAGPLSHELERIAEKLAKHCETTLKTNPEAIIADYRYGYIASILREGVLTKDASMDRIAWSDKVDRVITHRVLGPILMLSVLYGMFELTFFLSEEPTAWVEALFGWMSETATALIPPGLLQSLVVSGIIDGVGGVLGFVPLIAIMFVLLSFLEDLGYMARVAYMLDRVFKAFGLHGSSVMPFIVSGGIPGGCAVPGVMAARILRSPKERLATIMVAPFMVCGAKTPVFLLLVAAFFPDNAGRVMFYITLVAWAMALLVARVLRSTVIKGEATPFIMELPPYRIPTIRGVLIHAWERAWQYIKKAGTVILAVSVLIWATMTFPGLSPEQIAQYETRADAITQSLTEAEASGNADTMAELEETLAALENEQAEAALRNSLAGRVGTAMESVTSLAGFDWRTNIALTGGVAAKEIIVSTLGTAYSLGEVDPEESEPLSVRLARDPNFNTPTALALILFVMLYAPCAVTMVAIAREVGWRWAAFAMGFNTSLAFGLSVLVYQVGMRL